MSFDEYIMALSLRDLSLNPFRAGRCLSTQCKYDYSEYMNVSIPFEQGDVFRQNERWVKEMLKYVSIPFEQGDVFRQHLH